MIDRLQAAKAFYDKHLNDPYSKQSETAAFHLLGLQLDALENQGSGDARYDSDSRAVGKVTNPDDPHEWVNVDFSKDPFSGA